MCLSSKDVRKIVSWFYVFILNGTRISVWIWEWDKLSRLPRLLKSHPICRFWFVVVCFFLMGCYICPFIRFWNAALSKMTSFSPPWRAAFLNAAQINRSSLQIGKERVCLCIICHCLWLVTKIRGWKGAHGTRPTCHLPPCRNLELTARAVTHGHGEEINRSESWIMFVPIPWTTEREP